MPELCGAMPHGFFLFLFWMGKPLNRSALIGLVLLYSSLLTAASEGDPLVIQRLEGEFVFDGIPDEMAWQTTEPFPMVTHIPVFGKEPEEKTDIRMLFDEQNIYVGASFHSSDPSGILNTSKKRDELKPDCDWLAAVFDTYNDNETALSFWTTPSGLRTDLAIFNDAVGEMTMPLNSSWNTHWDVKSRMTEEGWYSEMVIPVSSLKFQEVDGEVVMGVIFIRWIPQHNGAYTFPPIPNEYGSWSIMKPSMARDVVFPGLKSRKPVYITPYAVAGFSQANELNEEETEYEYERDKKLDAGLDLKYGITSNLTLDLTVNTDFAQVEADDEKVNLTRFSLFFEEKRQFFLERASIFDFNTGGTTTMFYSRRIGLDDDGNIVPIIGGARLIGRKAGWDVGFLNMQTMRTDSLPSENFGVLRVKKRILNENSFAGGIYTSRLGLDGSFNQVYGIDGLLRVTGDEYLKIVWGQSFEKNLANKPLTIKNARYIINWQRRRDVGFYYDMYISGSGPEYNPGIGFQYRDDYHVVGGLINYNWLSPESSPIMKHGPRLSIFQWFSQSRGITEGFDADIIYVAEMKNFLSFGAGPGYHYEYVFEDFEFSDDVWVPVGEYHFSNIIAFANTPMMKPLMLSLEGNFGEYYDGSIIHIAAIPRWSISSSFLVHGAYIFSRLDFPDRNQRFISHIGRFKAELMFTTKISASAFVQYNSAQDGIVSNVRFRYNPREGNDLWLVYNEGTYTDLKRDIPHRPRLAGRTVMLKYTYTFRL
jgi:hypothetical protein